MPSGPRIRGNFSYGATTDNPLTAGATSFNSAGLATLPVVSSAHAVITLDPRRVHGEPEIVIVTSHTALATVATVTRGAYGTTARSHPQGTEWVHAPIDEDYTEILTSGTRPSDPYRGQMIFETDTNKFVARSTADIWQDAIPLGAWQTYTPTVTQSVAVTSTVQVARWTRIARLVFVYIRLAITSNGTTNNPVSVSLPVVAVNHGLTYDKGHGLIFDATTGTIYSGSWYSNTGDVQLLANGATGANAWGQSPNLPIQTGDLISFNLTYEAAA